MKESLKTFAENISSAKQGSVHQHLQSQPGPTAMTNSTGIPIGDITHSLNINGHVLASDSWLMEKQQTFNRGKTVERMVHPCGSGAFGYFEVTKPDLSQYCKAKFLNSPGKQTPVFVRFSTVTLGKEFPDSARNPRGFAIKFYTEEGNYDLVGLNFPIFFVRDPALGPDVIRSQQRNPQNFLIDYNSWFDFASLVPESLHCFTMLFSDHGTPYGFRMMDGYGAHTFKWVNQAGDQFYVKYHLISENGKKNFAWDDAVKMCGLDPDFAKRDLFETLEKGQEQKWKMCVQIAPASKIHAYEKFDPFDVTKVWPKSEFPLMEIGRLVLNKNPENYHRDVEQACFSPGALVPGIEPSPDALLQFRMFLYRDAQFYRMGANLHQVPVNCPFRAMSCNPFTRDGQLRVDENGGMEAHYYPNSIGKVKPDKRRDMQPVFVSGVIDRKSHSKHSNNLEEEMLQVRELYLRVMDDTARDHLHYNISVALKFCKRDIQMRSLIMFYKAHPSYAKGVMEKMGNNCSISWNELEETAKKCPQLVDANNAYFLLSPNIGSTSEESSSSSSSSYKSGTNVSNQSHPAALATMS